MGFSAFLIMAFHLNLINIANIGVEIFLLLSAMGCYFSLSKDFNIKSFYKKRVMRILPSFILISGALYIFRILFSSHDISIITYLGLGVFSGDLTFWFVPLILICYLTAPFIFKLIHCKHALIIIMLLSATIFFLSPTLNFLFARLPIFFLSMYFSKFIYNKKSIKKQYLYPIFILNILLLITLEIYLKSINIHWSILFIIYFFITIPTTLLLAKILSKINSIVLTFLGTISFETYLIQEFVSFSITNRITDNFYLFCIISSIITICLAWGTTICIKYFVKNSLFTIHK